MSDQSQPSLVGALAGVSAEGKDLAIKMLPQIALLAEQYLLGKLPALPTPPDPGSDLEKALRDSQAVRAKLDKLVEEANEAGSILKGALEAATKFVVTAAIGLMA